jgi:aminobenzoyl-glutamate utilization protein B
MDAKSTEYGDLSRQVWEFAEVGPLPIGSEAQVQPSRGGSSSGSPDAGDVSWQSAACAGSSVGRKGMMVAAKTMALTAMDLFTDLTQVKAAREHFEKRRAGFEYRSRVPEGQKPPLTYRDNK